MMILSVATWVTVAVVVLPIVVVVLMIEEKR